MPLVDILKVLGVSILPIVELRGAIPYGYFLDLPWEVVFPVSVIGNFLPVPFILLFIRKVLEFMKKIKYLDKMALWIEKKAHQKSADVLKYVTFGLLIFVAIPLPGTGAWTGALIAALFDIRMKKALPSIFCGVIIAGIICTVVCYCGIESLSFLLG